MSKGSRIMNPQDNMAFIQRFVVTAKEDWNPSQCLPQALPFSAALVAAADGPRLGVLIIAEFMFFPA